MNKYFDNATTSFPKPLAVAEAVKNAVLSGGSYGRAAYARAVDSTALVEKCRDQLASILHLPSSENIAFTLNATTACNTILNGLIFRHKHVWVSPLEHNAIMRPLERLKQTQGVKIDVLPHLSDGFVDVSQFANIDFSKTDLVIVNHQSNVNGVIQPVKAISSIIGSAKLMVDTTQSLGCIDFDANLADYVVFTAHKALLGVTGVGGFYVRNAENVAPFILGGTGSNSHSYDMPTFAPDKFEAGTPNTIGIAALSTALENRPLPKHSTADFQSLVAQLTDIQGVTMHKALHSENQGELLSVTHSRLTPSELSIELYSKFGIETRSGLHCAPLAHQSIGTFAHGTLRIAPSPYHDADDFTYLINSLTEICI